MTSSTDPRPSLQQIPESYPKSNLLRSSFLLLASYIIALLSTTAIHEIGHGLALASISIDFQLSLNPFGVSMAKPLSQIPESSMLFVTVAGTAAELLFGVVVIVILWRWRAPRLVPLLMTAPIAFLSTAGYFLFGSSVPGSDVVLMISVGIPAILIQVLGLLIVIMGAILFFLLFPLLGISPEYTLRDTFSILFIGMTLHGFGMIAYALVYQPLELYIGVANVISVAVMIPIFTFVYKRAYSRIDRLQHTDLVMPNTAIVYSVLAFAIVLISFELLFFN